MLHLPIGLDFNPGIQPIEFDTEPLATEMDCMVVGWGLTSGKAVTYFNYIIYIIIYNIII